MGIEALGGASNAALVINDRTENLKVYLRPKDSKFGNHSILVLCCNVRFILRMLVNVFFACVRFVYE